MQSGRYTTRATKRASTKHSFKRALGIVYTRDDVVPLDDNDPGMIDGWRCVPQPPTPSGDWLIVDSSHDYKTGWLRRVDLQGDGA
jgi:hypothetical protein